MVMYNEAIKVLQKEANQLRSELQRICRTQLIPEGELTAIIFVYQSRINELTDAILTLKSIETEELSDDGGQEETKD